MRFDEWLHIMLFLKQPSLSFPSFPCMVSTGHVLSSTRQPANQNGWFFSVSNLASPLSLPFRWASFAEDTKKLLKPRRTGKRTKTVGTGSKKASDLPHLSRDPIISPVVLDLCIFHIWKKESSPDFSEAPLMLFSSSLCHARAPTRGSHFGQVPWLEPPPLPFTDELWTLESELRSRAIFMDATCVVNPQGKTVNLKIFL